MDRNYQRLILGLLLATLAGPGFSEELVLKASKDTFGRSNKRNRNSGASEQLAIAGASNIRALIAFDLAGVTNEIGKAEFRFRQHDNSMPGSVSMVVAPMVNTTNNVAWREGLGNLGAQGENARPGEACYAFSAFRDVPWETQSGDPVANLGDSRLWNPPVATLNGLEWKEGGWVRVPIADVSLLEKIRKSGTPTITFGLWGTAGNGLYSVSSNNSEWSPELHLELKEDGK